ncbi:hypothetical protein PR048_028793 [Dryococelus australis]|uniref:Uncharacterized protein n=1 Tax=Dryococelus australis TaxID=614101 RepID=A0ABQ9GBI7_9NEOP|nr:hypothetical protein PR048_028793 [Dryococelus australis]
MAASFQKQVGNIKQFDGTGYTFWKHIIMLILEQSRVAEVLVKKPPEKEKELKEYKMIDIKARNIITQCLADNVLESRMNKTIAKELMDTFDSTYIKKRINRQDDLQR